MFSPDGYRTLNDVYIATLFAAAEKLQALGFSGRYEQHYLEDGSVDWSKDSFFYQDLWAKFYFERFLCAAETEHFVCSPDGNILRVCSWISRPKKMTSFHPTDDVEKAKEHALNHDGELLFVDRYTSIVRAPDKKLTGDDRKEWSVLALLHKSFEGWSSPFPGHTYSTGTVTGMPSAV